MKLKLDRFQFTDKSTIGRLLVNGVFQCYTLEDTVREIKDVHVSNWKLPGETAIPIGTYEVIIDHSNRFGKDLPRLLHVPGFEGVRIHSGNTDKDTEGCILTGTSYAENKVYNSRMAFMPLMTLLEHAYDLNEKIEIEIG